jgi:hypothetical protein
MVGTRFERLLVLASAGRNSQSHKLWLCRCDCGNERTVTESALIRGNTRSCGCLRNEKSAVKHGLTKGGKKGTPELSAYYWARYLSRRTGLPFGFEDFQQFLSDIGPRPSRAFVFDVKNIRLGYAPRNIYWRPRKKTGDKAEP